jgi:hypothetical protein
VEITVRYQLNGNDGLESMRVHDPSFRTSVVVGTLASLGLVAFGALLLALPGNSAFAWVSIGVGVALLALSTTQRILLTNRLRRQWNQIDPMELTVREGGLVASTRGTQTEVQWSRFLRFREADNHFLLYSSQDLYSLVPKRGFATQADMDAFRDLVAKRIGGS